MVGEQGYTWVWNQEGIESFAMTGGVSFPGIAGALEVKAEHCERRAVAWATRPGSGQHPLGSGGGSPLSLSPAVCVDSFPWGQRG